ncbi:MAG: hypothetical protein K6F56_10235 [Oscillospiraceae bacterium]|nr:hypothetical protein [Oscillospiraceae bacterium]
MKNRYRSALSHGRPKHARCDDFTLRHPPMDPGRRAKIFSPFSALRGFEEAIDEKRKLYVEKRELNEEEQQDLNRTLSFLRERTANLRLARQAHITAVVTCYVPCMDENHEAYGRRGSYETVTGTVWRVDPVLHKTILIGDKEIEIADIAAITIGEES